MQANIKRTIGGVENIYKFPARASDALAMLQEVDTDHAALLDVFHDLSSLLSTLSVAEDLLADLRRQATLARARPASLLANIRPFSNLLFTALHPDSLPQTLNLVAVQVLLQ